MRRGAKPGSEILAATRLEYENRAGSAPTPPAACAPRPIVPSAPRRTTRLHPAAPRSSAPPTREDRIRRKPECAMSLAAHPDLHSNSATYASAQRRCRIVLTSCCTVNCGQTPPKARPRPSTINEEAQPSSESNSSTDSQAAIPTWHRPRLNESPGRPGPDSAGGRYPVPLCSTDEVTIPSEAQPEDSTTGATADAMPKIGRLTTEYPSTTPSGDSHSNPCCRCWRPLPPVAKTGSRR